MLETQLVRYLNQLRERRPLPMRVRLWNGEEISLGDPPSVLLALRSKSSARRLLNPDLDSLGSAYVNGEVDLEGPIREVIEVAAGMASDADDKRGRGALPDWIARHTRNSDRQAIAYHYDVSNAFYAAWLDPAMVYSCAYFPTGEESLAQAQTLKLDLVCRKLRLEPGMRLLDIGCGWGALAMHAARHYGAQVLGITLSQNQYALACQRVTEAGLAEQIQIALMDYRDLPTDSPFDRISSIGMFEHVGLENLPDYFSRVTHLLKPGGLTLQHGITSADADSRSVGLGAGKFISRHVFPDGELPHVSRAIQDMARAGLELTDAESLRRHYARTLWHWSEAYEARYAQMVEIAGERRARIWRVYLAGCAHAFDHGWINIYQLLAARPAMEADGARIEQPMSRADIYRD